MVTFEILERSIGMDEITGKSGTKNIQQTADVQIRAKLRLGEVERLIKKHRIVVPCLSRQTLQTMCEDGTFETAGTGPGHVGWLVYEDSFMRWIEALDSGR